MNINICLLNCNYGYFLFWLTVFLKRCASTAFTAICENDRDDANLKKYILSSIKINSNIKPLAAKPFQWCAIIAFTAV